MTYLFRWFRSNTDLVESSRRRKSDHKLRVSLGHSIEASAAFPSVLESPDSDAIDRTDDNDRRNKLLSPEATYLTASTTTTTTTTALTSSADGSPASSMRESDHTTDIINRIIGDRRKPGVGYLR